MKYLSIFIFSILLLYCCEKDDVCIDPLTPRLHIGFYKDNKTIIMDSLYILWSGKKDTIFEGKKVNKALASLNFLDNHTTLALHAYINKVKTIDNLTISYDKERKFVSKACGFKYIYNHSKANATKVGIKKIEWVRIEKNKKITKLKTRNIVFEKDQHIRIYY